MKENFSRDIKNLAEPFGEHPKISFTDQDEKSVSVKVENVSEELKSKIDEYLKAKSS